MTTLHGVIRSIRLGLVFVVLGLPLLVWSSSAYPYVVPRAVAFRVLVGVAAILTLSLHLGRYRTPNRSAFSWPTLSPIALAGVSLLALAALSSATGIDPERSVWSRLSRMHGLVTMAHLLLFGWVLVQTLGPDRRLWSLYLQTSVIVALLCLALAVASGGLRWSGPLGSPTFLAGYLLMHAIGTAWLSRRPEQSAHSRLLWGLATVGLSVGVWGTGTRGAIVAGIVAALAAALIRWRSSLPKNWVARTGGIVGVVAGFVGIAWVVSAAVPYRRSVVLSRFAQLQQGNDRVYLWQIAWDATRERPLLGWGPENFQAAYVRHFHPALGADVQWADRVHNACLEWLVSTGVPGLLAYLTVFGTAAFVAARSGSLATRDRAAVFAALTAYFVHTSFAFADLPLFVVLVGCLAALHATNQSASAHTGTGPKSRRLRVFAGLVLSTAGLVCVVANVRPLARGMAVHRALQPDADATAALRWMRSAAIDGGESTAETVEYWCAVALSRMVSDPNVPASVRTEYIDGCLNSMSRLRLYSPHNMRTAYTQALFWSNTGRADRASEALRDIATVAPDMPLIWLALSQSEQARGATHNAHSAVQTAFELAPGDDTVRVAYAASLIRNGKLRTATRILQDRAEQRPSILLDDSLVSAANDVGRPELLGTLWVQYARQERPAFREKLRVFLSDGG